MNPNSSPSAYLSVADFLARKDERSVAQWASDDPQNPVSVANLPANANVQAAIDAACGMLESAVLRSGRYSVADLQALQGMSLEYMKKILSDIAMYNLIGRRPGPAPPETALSSYEEAIKALNDLSDGIRIFAFREAELAGVSSTKKFSTIDYQANNLIPYRWTRAFGVRQGSRRFLG